MNNQSEAYQYWRKKTTEEVRDFRLEAGFYNCSYDKGNIIELEMQSAKIGIYKVIEKIDFFDPPDMTKYIYLEFLGYKGIKPIKECTYKEYKELYYFGFNKEFYQKNKFGVFDFVGTNRDDDWV
ncbi:MAG: hypothetical protein ACK5MH_09140 [Bacteroidales bacterium]